MKDEAERFRAICFIIRVDESRFKKLYNDLESSACRGMDEYPTTLTATYDFLVRESGVYNNTINNGDRRFQRGGGDNTVQDKGRCGGCSNGMLYKQKVDAAADEE